MTQVEKVQFNDEVGIFTIFDRLTLTWAAAVLDLKCLSGPGFDFVLDLSAINDDTEAGGSVRHEPGKVVGHSPSPSPPPASPTWSCSQSTLGFSWSMSWRSQLSCPVIKIIQSDQSFHDKSFRCSGALNWHSEKYKKIACFTNLCLFWSMYT